MPSLIYAQEGCSLGSLKGGYGFSITGQNLAANVSYALIGRFVADGSGKFTGLALQNVSGKVSKPPFHGTYTIDPDCTGAATIALGDDTAHLYFVLTQNGTQLYIVDSDEQVIETGTATKQSVKPGLKQ
ncbi:MAG: hypothetical protein JO340_05450 [Acidobacteriaceae bacterium]|nr:hypothetical protein [Acidobacteriaceae bacterium]